MEMRYHKEVEIKAGKTTLPGELIIPSEVNSIVIFSHGSGSSRFSPRNKIVSEYLNNKGMATLLFDLLTPQEDQRYSTRFDIDLLTRRLIGATEWVRKFKETRELSIGYFGASTGAASALKAAAYLPGIGAVVSRGGRPDMAMDVLDKVGSPTLLIVGSLDYDVIQLNELAYARLNCKKKLEIVEGASHLFEEPGKMQIVCDKASNWFEEYLHPVKTV